MRSAAADPASRGSAFCPRVRTKGRRAGWALALALLGVLPRLAVSGQMPPPVTLRSPIRVWVDQLGYRTAGRKILIIASDKPLPRDETLMFDLTEATTLKVVWSSFDHPEAIRRFHDGRKDGESGDCVAQLDLTGFKKPGRYFVAVRGEENAERSYLFNIGDDVYRHSALAAWKMLYYNRADTAKPEKHAGPWHHQPAHRGPHQATQARVYAWTGKPHWEPVGSEVADPTPRDVSGGWWDAGNFDKYMGNTTTCHNELLLALQLLGDAPKDGELNIPESGNGIPDVLDEVRYGTEFLLRMADPTGAAFGRVYERTACPPDADTSPVMLTQTASGATMNRAAALAYAALVWQERGLDPAFAKKCMDESLKSWKLLEAKPHPWPADPKDPKKPAYTGEWFFVDYDQCRALAAACYFKATGEKRFDAVVQEGFRKWNHMGPGESKELYPTIWVYTHTPGADAALVARMKKMLTDAAEGVVKQTGSHRAYAAGIRGYWWGSNRLIGSSGVNCILAAELAADAAARPRFLDAAEEYIHYLHGRNPIGMCYLTNMKQFGAEHSVMVMFHAWLGNPSKQNDPYGGKFVGEGPGKVGPPPGYVVGGANGGMRHYLDSLSGGKPWEFSEPCLSYQSPCVILLSYFGQRRP